LKYAIIKKIYKGILIKKNLFEMGASFESDWQSDNKNKSNIPKNIAIKLPSKHQLYFSKEKRRAKVITIVKPFYLNDKILRELLKTLKKKLGTGGTMKKYSLEFQGDIKEKLKKELMEAGYRFKG
jgi:translation initiation factor 1